MPPRIPAPNASRRAHLFAASLLWTLVGLGLLAAGTAWAVTSGSPAAAPILLLAAMAGAAKARFILRKTANRIAERIERRGDSRCIGGFLSWRSWLLVLSMMAFGRLLRASPLAPVARGAIYAAIGVAMLGGSLFLWRRWRRSTRGDAQAPLRAV
jgi:hypothetical protein